MSFSLTRVATEFAAHGARNSNRSEHQEHTSCKGEGPAVAAYRAVVEKENAATQKKIALHDSMR